MDEEKIIREAVGYIQELFKDNTDGHDADHTLRVYYNAMKLADQNECDRFKVALGALLHDCDDHKLFGTANNENARGFLSAHEVDQETIDDIIAIINSVSFSKNQGKKPASIEGMIVQDADRLDALGAIGIARAFAYGGSRQRSLDMTIAHFHEKLLKLKDQMNTQAGRQEAQKRHDYLEEFLKRYQQETHYE